ncbi:MAG: response regulator [Treponema sp.]|jgi:DNA-binding response OmpR family regulator|nr:response regulator [Treponema sp.]
MNTQNKILVVDDDPINRDFFQLMLSKLGFVVEEASDGVDALERLKNFKANLILLDNIMPRMSGFDLTKLLKEDENYREIPIIMFSALDDVKDKLTGFELGVDDYITKPFNFTEVLARIKATLRNRELFAQIAVRESRLNLAEILNRDIRQNLNDFAKSIDDLDAVVKLVPSAVESIDADILSKLAGDILGKTDAIRKYVAELDTRIERTVSEWETLKKNEIGLPALEAEIRKFLHQD